MPIMEKVFNPTLEKQEVMINNRVYTFLPRSYCDVSEFESPIIEKEYAHKGLVVVRHGKSFKEIERSGLLNYMQTLDERIKNYQAWMDQKRIEGKTIDEPLEYKRAKRWKEELYSRLNMEKPIVEELSFNDLKDGGIKKEEKIEEAPVKRRGRPAKEMTSFTEVPGV